MPTLTLSTSSLLSGKPVVHETFIADSISGKTLDHFAVTCKLALSVKSTKCKTIKYRNLKAIDVDVLNTTLSQKLSSVQLIQDVDTQVNLYNNIMTEALDTLAPIVEKRIQMRTTFPWYNVDLKNAKKLCRKSERLWKKSKLLSHKLAFKEQCAKFNKLLYNSKKSFILSSIKTCKKDNKKLYQIVGKFLKSYSSNKLPQICPAHELPNAFATFFQNKILMLHQDLSTNQSAVCAPEENDVVFDGTTFDQFNPVTTVDVNNILHSLNSTNCKLDPLPAVLLKKCSSVVVNAITVIINNSLKSSQVPLEFKKAIISPLMKSHNLDPDTLANYRPISHLSFLSKVLEKVVAGQLNEHLAINNIHDKFQSAYRTGFSTETALIRITDDILFALDNKCFIALIMIDMSAAFDTIDHNILLYRLSHHFGINNSVLSWFRSYLNNRSHCVDVNNNVSRSFQLFSGVPQGSVLAPILFTLYIKPLTSIISNLGFSYHFYADDVQFYVTFDADKTLDANVLTKCLKAVEQWLCCNKLKLNNKKTQCILFGRTCKQSSSIANAFNTVDIPLTSSICVKNLGVLLDSNLSMEGQIKSIIKKCFFNIRNIGKIRKYLDEDSCKMLVNNLIISHLDYCNALYHGLPDCLLNQLQRVQNTAARLVLCIRKSAHITPVLMKLHWLPVQHRIKFKILMQVFKILNGQSPLYLVDLISRHVPTRALRSRDTNLLAVPRSSSKFSDRRFSVSGPRLWNDLPIYIKNAESLTQFKTLLKTYFFTQVFVEA